jgi:integrase
VTASGAVGCGFDPRRAHHSKPAVLLRNITFFLFVLTKSEHFPNSLDVKTPEKFPVQVKKGNSIVRIYRHENDGYPEFKLAYYLSGKRKFETFSDFARAKKRADNINNSVSDGNLEIHTLPKEEFILYKRATEALARIKIPIDQAAQDYAKAVERLQGVTVAEAVLFYLQKHPRNFQRVTTKEAVLKLIASKEKDGLSPEYVKDLEIRLRNFSEAINVNVSDLTADLINEFLRDGLEEMSGRSRNNYRTAIGTLLNYAEAQGWMPRDHIRLEHLARAKEAGFVIDIYTPKEMRTLLSCVMNDPAESLPGYNRRYAERRDEMLAFLVLGGFAGLRTKELVHQQWEDINIDRGHIRVSQVKGNTAQRRLVPISENLKEWLMICRKEQGVVCEYPRPWEALRRVAQRAGVALKHNALRHSFISYRVAVTQNVPQTSLEAGNSVGMIHKHYRELVTPEDAEAWFSTTPHSF